MKQLLCLATAELKGHAAPFLANHAHYAKANGYEYHLATEKFWPGLHPSFSKVYEIDRALREGAEIVLWADADVAFMDHNFDLASLLVDDYFMAAYHQTNWPNWVYLCAGLTVWRNTPESVKFVTEWYRRVDKGYIEHTPWEQWYLDELVRESNYKGIRACSGHEIGCFCPQIWHDGTIWKPGMPTIHMAGPGTWEKKASVFDRVYAAQVKRKI